LGLLGVFIGKFIFIYLELVYFSHFLFVYLYTSFVLKKILFFPFLQFSGSV